MSNSLSKSLVIVQPNILNDRTDIQNRILYKAKLSIFNLA